MNDLYFMRLVNRDRNLTKIYLESVNGVNIDLHGPIRRRLFNELTPELRLKYNEIVLEEEGDMIIKETTMSHSIDLLVKLNSWKELVAGLAQFAKNKNIFLRQIGLAEQAKVWSRIERIVAGLPKNPEL